jgi:hypothetical protein
MSCRLTSDGARTASSSTLSSRSVVDFSPSFSLGPLLASAKKSEKSETRNNCSSRRPGQHKSSSARFIIHSSSNRLGVHEASCSKRAERERDRIPRAKGLEALPKRCPNSKVVSRQCLSPAPVGAAERSNTKKKAKMSF